MSAKRKSRGGRPSLFSSEFRRDAVGLVLDEQRAIADVARSVGVNEGTLGNWVRLERIDVVNAPVSPLMNAVSSPIFGRRTPGCGWSATSSNDRWLSG